MAPFCFSSFYAAILVMCLHICYAALMLFIKNSRPLFNFSSTI